MAGQFKHPFNEFHTAFKALVKKLPKEVSIIANEEFKHNFRIGGYRGNKGVVFWKKRKKETKKTIGKEVLTGTGRLRRGLMPAPTFETARVINDVPYAAVHNEGAEISRAARRQVIHFKKFKAGKKKGKQQFAKAGNATHAQKVNIGAHKTNMPARPFMITTNPLLDNIEKHINNKIQDAWDKS